ncbi:MAG: TlpA disulfide reductase family protein, partial [Luteolibacter sp.]
MRYLIYLPLLLVSSVGMGSEESTAELGADSSLEANAVLEIGARAPVFRPEKWLKGEPVDEFQDDPIYLIECWATWCGPCIASIPKLNELHQHFEKKGLVVIGANVLGDTHQKAQAFVARMGDRMAYRIAYDGE